MKFNQYNVMNPEGAGEGGAGAPAAAPAPTPAPAAAPPAATPQEITPSSTATPPTAEKKSEATTGTGDAVLDYAVGFIEQAGISSDSAAFIAAMEGDFSLLQVEFLQKGTQGGDKIIAILEQKFAEHSAKQQTHTQETNKLIFEAVGGEAQWGAIKDWAKKNAEPEEVAAINAAFKQGGAMAKMLAHYLALQFNAANGGANQGAPTTKQEASTAIPSTGKLTRAEYTEAVTALRNKVGYNIDSHPEYIALRRRLA